MDSPYVRYPDVLGDDLVFVADDDIWLGSVRGGRAQRLTTDRAPAANPRLSGDGRRIAWTSSRAGTPDAYVFDRDAGAVTRLTWWGAGVVVGWHGDRVVIASGHQEIERPVTRLYLVALDGTTEKLSVGPAGSGAWSTDGRLALTTPNFREAPFWKRYRGGTASRLWIQQPDGTWLRALPEEHAGLNCPNWYGDRVLFCSDLAAGRTTITDPHAQQQLFSVDATGADLVQHTHHDEALGYVRDARTDGRTVVYHAHGRLYALDDLAGAPPRPIAVDLGIGVPAPLRPTATENLTSVRPDHAGTGSLVNWRGATYYLTHRAGPARALAVTDGVRTREPVVLGTTGLAAYVTDAGGTDALELRAVDGLDEPRTIAAGQLGYVIGLAAAPGGEMIAVTSHDGAVRLVGTDGTVRLLDDSRQGEVESLAWSPDSRYLVWAAPLTSDAESRSQLRCLDVRALGTPAPGHPGPEAQDLRLATAESGAPLSDGGDPDAARQDDKGRARPDDSGTAWVALTAGTYSDTEPAFTADGKHLAWISRRTFDPQYNGHGFAMSFSNVARPWLAPLSAADPLPFGVSADGWPLGKPDDKGKDSTHPVIPAQAGTPGALSVDPTPVVPTVIPAEAGTPGGLSVDPTPGISRDPGLRRDDSEASSTPGTPTCHLDADGFEARAVGLPVPSGEYTNLRAVKDGLAWLRDPGWTGVLGTTWTGADGECPAHELERFSFESRKVETLVDKADSFEVSGDGEILVVRHGDDVTAQPARRIGPDDKDSTVAVDLGRLRRSVDRRAEWRGMFEENGRIMAYQFWREDMDGTDWSAVLARYRPLIDRCLTRGDVVDVLYECVAELNTSHSYVNPPAWPNPRPAGYLGVEVTAVADGFRIDRILPGDSSDPASWQPLRRAGVDARAGDVIAAVDGQPCTGVPALGALLEGAAGKPVELVLKRDGVPRRVSVVPLPREDELRYHDWVAGRAARVAEVGGGRLGYLHVPNMMGLGWAQLERMIEEAALHEGVIADVRYNGGGHTSQLVIERLVRKVIGWDVVRHIDAGYPYPAQGMRGPVVVLTNEMAGSDGDIITAVSKHHGLTVMGTRTWGGVIGIDGRYGLVDGTSITQPRYSGWWDGFGWGIENHGVDPDIEVALRPDQWDSVDDVQLDAAIAEALRQLSVRPAVRPPAVPPPRFAVGAVAG